MTLCCGVRMVAVGHWVRPGFETSGTVLRCEKCGAERMENTRRFDDTIR